MFEYIDKKKCFNSLTLFSKGINVQIDQTDKNYREIMYNSRIQWKIWERVHLTCPAATARVEKLEENGVIEGSNIKVNQAIRCFM